MWLGVWQIQRGLQKKQIQRHFMQNQQPPAKRLNTLQPITQAQNYKNVLLEGYFDNAHSFLLDNKVYDHRIGYEVLTPFYVKNKRSPILVNRGWMPQGPSRKHKPFIPPVLGDRSIQGVLFWPEETFHFPEIIEQSWPKRIQALTPSFLEKNHFTPFVLIMEKPLGTLFKANWQPFHFPATRHYAYALQWFLFSCILLISLVRINFQK